MDILFIDFGSRHAQEVADKLTQRQISFDRIPWQEADISALNGRYKGVILSGSPYAAHREGSPFIDKSAFEQKIPVLGICYGMQFIAHTYGARVAAAEQDEHTTTKIEFLGGELAAGLPTQAYVEMRHEDRVYELPDGFIVTAKTKDCPIAAMEHPQKKLYAVQYHPELGGCGDAILDNFLFAICNIKN